LENKVGEFERKIRCYFSAEVVPVQHKKITETNHLPEYNISIEDDVVMFTRKEPPKENKLPDQLPKHVSKKEIEKHARPGESYEQAADRLKKLKAKPGETFDQTMARKKSLNDLKAILK